MAGEIDRKKLMQLVESLEDQGCTSKRTKKGIMIRFPDGGGVTFHMTPSDRRSGLNQRAVIRQHGLQWPFSAA